MGKKADAREQRKKEKLARFDSRKEAYINSVTSEKTPRHTTTTPLTQTPRVAPHIERELGSSFKIPKNIKDGSRFDLMVCWCRSQADLKDSWSWGEPRAWTDNEWSNTIYPKFLEFSRLTWGEIDQFSSESGHKMHHGHEICSVTQEAQDRWLELKLEQFDTVFRFRLGGTKRVWGYIVQGHFHIIWWDRSHTIYPTEQN